jgi:hypothetical protein
MSTPTRLMRGHAAAQSPSVRRPAWRLGLGLLLALSLPPTVNPPVAEKPTVAAARGIGPDTLAVIVNDADPASRQIGAYYPHKRRIPVRNVIHVSFPAGKPIMTRAEFERIMASVNARASPSIQAYALTWTVPYRVGCMSITTAFAAGYDEAFCASGCKATRASPYYDSDSQLPYEAYGWRPAMMLAGGSFDDV